MCEIKDIYPQIGDIVAWENAYFEIENVVENQFLGGQPEKNYSLLCNAHLSRNSKINLKGTEHIMVDYNKVNNPFITLKKLSGTDEKSFTAKLNSSPPSVDNDAYRSNMKKSKDSFYSDNRAEKMRDDSNDVDYDKYTVTLMDIDNILYEYFINVINPQVEDANNSIISVPVRHASPERWSAIQRDGVYRDTKGMVQKPMIIFSRTSVSNDDSFAHFNRHLNVPFVKKFTKKNMYDKFSALTGAKPIQEIHNIAFPDHVILNYDFTMTTEYVQQMNTLVEIVNWASNDYWGDPGRLKFRASVDSFTNNVETPSDDDRVVTTTFSLTVNAYLLPEVFNNTKTKQKSLTNERAIFGTEIISDTTNIHGTPQSVLNSGFSKNIILNRKIEKYFWMEMLVMNTKYDYGMMKNFILYILMIFHTKFHLQL